MYNRAVAVVVLCVMCVITGCRSGDPKDGEELTRQWRAINLKRYAAADDSGYLFRRHYDTAHSAGKKDVMRRERDRIIQELLVIADESHDHVDTLLHWGRGGLQSWADIAALGTSGAATIAGGAQAKTVLAGISTFIQGSQIAIDKRLFAEQASPAVLATMKRLRLQALEKITVGLTKDVDEYDLDTALRDWVTYSYAGSVPDAIQELTRTASQELQEEVQRINRLRGVATRPGGPLNTSPHDP